MHSLIQQLIGNGPVITDGAWGTQLQRRGLVSGEPPDLWNLLRPEEVAAVAQSYVDAGSQVILTNTFGANRVRLAGVAESSQIREVNWQGVRISRNAARGRASVFASIGPSGRMLAAGDIGTDELRAAFDEQAEVLSEAGADALTIETMGDLEEAKLAVAAAHATGLPVVACMVFDSGRDKDRTLTGVTPEQSAVELAGAGADVIGANCGHGVANFVTICRRIKQASGLPVWIKPNAGLPEIENGRTVYRTTPEEFASFGPALVEAGASFIGGCCGTDPGFIKALKAQITRGEAAQ